jgi:hypothetical protein
MGRPYFDLVNSVREWEKGIGLFSSFLKDNNKKLHIYMA